MANTSQPFLVLCLALAAAFWSNAPYFAGAARDLQEPERQDSAQTGRPFLNSYSCGFFNLSDPVDGGTPHQACHGPSGEIDFCCRSGRSGCSCPLVAGSGPSCYNYEKDNMLDDLTGEECRPFLPEVVDLSFQRRQLACNITHCPLQDLCGNPENHGTGYNQIIYCAYTVGRILYGEPSNVYACSYDLNGYLTGFVQAEGYTDDPNCCPTHLNC